MKPVHLSAVLNIDSLAAEVEAGFVTARPHPSEPYVIYNYSAQCQWERRWNEITRACRGLIVNTQTGEVVARPWPKFYNHSEHEEGVLDLRAPARVTDKMDGSLGILYPLTNGGWAVATRGSFESEQARHATEVLRSRYAAWANACDPEYTHLYEIVYPGNRVVVDYGGMDDLVLLGAVVTADGSSVPADEIFWPGPKVASFEARSLAEALALEPRPNAEGVVVTLLDSGMMVKVKQEDYVALHRLVTGLSEKSVWRHLAAEGTLSELLESVPDEFHAWLREVAGRLEEEYDAILAKAHADHDEIVASLPEGWTRKDYALVAKGRDNSHLLFGLLSERPVADAIWKQLEPMGSRTMLDITEDTA